MLLFRLAAILCIALASSAFGQTPTSIPNLSAAGVAAGADLVPTSQGGSAAATKQTLSSIGLWVNTTGRFAPSKTVQVACGANLTNLIATNGGGANAATPVLYQLAGSAASPCTYSGFTPTCVSNIVIQGDTSSPVGANTIIDGGEAAGASSTMFLNGQPSVAGGTGCQNVTLQYLTIQNYGGAQPGSSGTAGLGSACGGAPNVSSTSTSVSGTALTIAGAITGTIKVGFPVQANDGTNVVPAGTYLASGSGNNWTLNQSIGTVNSTTFNYSENWCMQFAAGDGWTLTHDTFTKSGGYGFQTVGGNILITQNLFKSNYHGGVTIQMGWAGSNGGPVVFTNNECTNDNLRGDDPTNDANGCLKAVFQGGASIGGNTAGALYVTNNYAHDNYAIAYWLDVHDVLTYFAQGNTAINTIASGAYATYPIECYRFEVSASAEISHNIAIQCSNAAGYTIVNSGMARLHDNYTYVDNVRAHPSTGGIQAWATCRSDNPNSVVPATGITAWNNLTVFAGQPSTVAIGVGAYDITGPIGASCSGGQTFPTALQYATNVFYNNRYYVPNYSVTVGAGVWAFGASSTAPTSIASVQGDLNPWHAPFYYASGAGNYLAYATGDCNVHITQVPAGGPGVVEGMALWTTSSITGLSTGQNMVISAAGGGTGTYAINWCPNFASVGSPVQLSAAFPGNEELGSTQITGVKTTGSTITSSNVLTIGTVVSGTIATGMVVAGNDGTHPPIPFGTYITDNISGSGNGSTWHVNNTGLTLNSTAVYMNSFGSLLLGCQVAISLGGCPNGAGM